MAAPTGIPADINKFIGREHLLEKAAATLRHVRVLALTGEGGVGKTRAATTLARLVADRYRDGVAWVELVDLPAGTDRLEAELVTALGLPDNSARPTGERLVAHLRDREMLLVLDNCEHLVGDPLGAAGPGPLPQLLARLLQAAPAVTVLATTRSRLAIGEHLLPVPPMATDNQVSDAMQLLIERAAAVDIEITADNPTALRLVREVDGLPLAIELAASWLWSLTLEDIIAGVHDPEKLLDAPLPTQQDHHRTLRRAMDWSARQLTDSGRRMWAIAAEFRSGFRAEALVHVYRQLGLADESGVIALLGRLVNHSILRASTIDGVARYRMLEPVRQFGTTLDIDGLDRSDIRDAHADYYSGQSALGGTEWFGPHEVVWLRSVLVQRGNLAAAVEHLLETGHADRALEMAVNLARNRAHTYGARINTIRDLIVACLDRHTGDPSGLQVTGMAIVAWTAVVQGRVDLGRPLLDSAHKHAAQLGYPVPALDYVEGVYLALAEVDPDRARSSITVLDAAAAATETASDRIMVDLFAVLAEILHGSPCQAVQRGAAALDTTLAAGAPWATTWARWVLALALVSTDQLDAAADQIHQGLDVQHELGDHGGISGSIWLAAIISGRRGQHTLAARLFGAADARERTTEVSLHAAWPLLRMRRIAENACRQGIGGQTYAELYADGEQLAPATAVQLALSAVAASSPAPLVAHVAPLGGLTSREQEVTENLATGHTNEEIATLLGIGKRTVDTHVSNAFAKTGTRNRAALAAWYLHAQAS